MQYKIIFGAPCVAQCGAACGAPCGATGGAACGVACSTACGVAYGAAQRAVHWSQEWFKANQFIYNSNVLINLTVLVFYWNVKKGYKFNIQLFESLCRTGNNTISYPCKIVSSSQYKTFFTNLLLSLTAKNWMLINICWKLKLEKDFAKVTFWWGSKILPSSV